MRHPRCDRTHNDPQRVKRGQNEHIEKRHLLEGERVGQRYRDVGAKRESEHRLDEPGRNKAANYHDRSDHQSLRHRQMASR